MRNLEPFDWWFTGLRREQSPTRAGLRKVEDHRTPTGKQMKKVSVLADWTMAAGGCVRGSARDSEAGAVRARIYQHRAASRALRFRRAGADARSGRWGGKKLECGIHTFSEKV